MADASNGVVGRVVALWRFPVKSMLGEECNALEIADRGVFGDRAFALIDAETGKVVSAKNPRRWPNLFDFRASFVEPTLEGRTLPPAWVFLPDGSSLTTESSDFDARLSNALGREVRLARSAIEGAKAEGYWPDVDWLPHRDEEFTFPLPPGTFFDGGSIHLLTTATLDRLRQIAPASRFEARRFRPNLVIEVTDGSDGFVEDGWIGHALVIGDVRLRIVGPCPRCIMTTLSQGDLPKDPGVLRAAVQANNANVGVYATVLQTGRIRRGDTVAVEGA